MEKTGKKTKKYGSKYADKYQARCKRARKLGAFVLDQEGKERPAPSPVLDTLATLPV